MAFNKSNKYLKRGIALTPVKFGISFNTTFLNQAGALIHVYNDGSVQLNHGGTEMGQGLNTKVAQIVSHEFQIDLEKVRITATTTGKVPNTSATAASSGTDLNGMAAMRAAREIKSRMIDFLAEAYQTKPDNVRFVNNMVHVGAETISFPRQCAGHIWGVFPCRPLVITRHQNLNGMGQPCVAVPSIILLMEQPYPRWLLTF